MTILQSHVQNNLNIINTFHTESFFDSAEVRGWLFLLKTTFPLWFLTSSRDCCLMWQMSVATLFNNQYRVTLGEYFWVHYEWKINTVLEVNNRIAQIHFYLFIYFITATVNLEKVNIYLLASWLSHFSPSLPESFFKEIPNWRVARGWSTNRFLWSNVRHKRPSSKPSWV